jgi:outer membrane receptor protein involved in Fe transport
MSESSGLFGRFMLLSLSCAAFTALPVYAADNPAADGQSTASDAAQPEEVVVTGVARPVNRLESSVSTSSLSAADILQTVPRSTEEVFRALPGIRSESSGGEGNANMTIRGIPLATGGSKYLQLQEDGLPVLEYGDMNFANADNFIKYDWSVQRVESIRGGSASTFASDSPGGIINFISNTGDKDGGAVGASFGLDYNEMRTDFRYGGKLSDTLNFHVGGYYRTGEGVRHTGFNGDNGGQVKVNLTKQLDGGFFRLYVKHLDDHVSSYLPSPVFVKSNSSYGPVPGYDASKDSLYSAYQTQINTFDAYGNPVNRDMTDGIHAKSNSFGFEFDKDAGQGWHVNDKFRNSTVGGGFISPFTDTFGIGVLPAQQWGDALCATSKDAAGAAATGCAGTTVTYADGPNKGKPYAGLAWTNLIFDTTFRDVGSLINDLKISKDIGPVTATAGYYRAHQKIAIDWNSWQFLVESVSRNPVGLNVVSSTGQKIAQNGLYWPSLLSFAWDLNYDTTAPYLSLAGAMDKFHWDGSVRFDEVKARGTLHSACCGSAGGFDYNNDGTIDVFEARGAAFVTGGTAPSRVNYDARHTEYSLGGSYLFADHSSVFGRYSEGARFDADRLLQIQGALDSGGGLTSATKGYDLVKQLEIGYKYHRRGTSLYLTFFDTTTDETNADITTGETFLRTYKADGLEVEGDWQADNGFGVNGNFTYTHAKIDKDKLNAAVIGNKPRRQADLIWTITPHFRTGAWNVGATLQGSTSYYLQDVNKLQQGAYTIINLFGTWNATDSLSASLNVNNVADTFVLTEAEEGAAATGSIIRGRPLNGRSTNLSLSYRF